jgi:hypothetical protein
MSVAVVEASPATPEPSPPASDAWPLARDADPILVVDLRERRVTYRGREIRTRSPHHLQRAPLLALAVLASRAGQVVTAAELAEGMRELGGLHKKVVEPDTRDLRYKMLEPFRKALAGVVDSMELELLVKSVTSTGLRLTIPGRARVISAAGRKAAE